MKTVSRVNKRLISFAAGLVCLLLCMIITAQLSPAYAGSHNAKQANDFGSITVGSSTKYYDSVPGLLDDLEEYEECSIQVEMFKDWYMGKNCQWIEIASGSDKNHTKVTFNMGGYTIDRNIPNDEYDDDYLVFNIGKYVDMTIDGGWHEPMNTKCFTGNGYGGGWDSTYYYKGGGIVGGRFDESMWSSPEGGGGIYLNSCSTLTLKNVTVGGCKSVDGEGGGVYVDSHSTLNMEGSSIKGCQTTDEGGGGVYLAGSSTLNMNSSTIYDNGSYDEGGGILIDEEDVIVNLKNNSTIEGNRATDNGGGIAILNDNCAIRGDDSLSCSIKENRSTYSTTVDSRHNGGGVYFENPGVISNVKIEENTTNYGNGGGLFLASDKLTGRHYTVENCIFDSNNAHDKTSKLTCSEGGGIYIDDNGTEIRNCSFRNNSAYNAGGGMYINAEDVKVSDCTFEYNDADASIDGYDCKGGGAYINGANPVFRNCRFTNNHADIKGGGLFIDSNNGIYDCARFTGKTLIRDNVARDGNICIQRNNLYVDTDDSVQFHDLTPGSRIFLGSEGFEYNKLLSDYKNRTDESQKKYLTLEHDDPYMILDFTERSEYNVSLRIMKEGPLEHTVGFDSNGGSTVPEQTVADGRMVEKPKDPVNEGSVFTGWYLEDPESGAKELWDFNDSVYSDMTLVAGWFNGYKVTFYSNSGEGTMEPVYKLPGEYTLPECDFTAPEGKEFDCWSIKIDGESDSGLQPGDVITITDKEVKLYAMWKDAPAQVNVELVANNGTDDSKTVTAEAGTYELPECDFTAPKNKEFKGWAYAADGDVIEDPSISLKKDTSLYAIWKPAEKIDPEYTVPTGLKGTCGEMLDSIELPEAEGGTWVWSDKNRRIHGINDDKFLLTYIPEDTDKYNVVEGIEVNVDVDHDFSAGEITLDATCTRGETKVYICSTCGDGYVKETGAPEGHSFVESEIPDGGIQSTCTKCGFTETDYGEGSDHHFASEKTVDKKATRDSDGSRSLHCTDEDCAAVKDSEIIESPAFITLSQGVFDYDGESKAPEVSVFDRANKKLIAGKDYKLVFPDDCACAGSKIITVMLGNAYDGTLYTEYVVDPISIVREHPELSETVFTYTGSEIEPQVVAGDLKKGEDFMVEYRDNISTGTATAVITGTDNFTGKVEKTFTIKKASIAELDVKLDRSSATYTGSEIKPKVTAGDLKEGTDFKVDYYGNISAGTAVAVIKGTGNYTGTTDKTFKIVPKKASVKSAKAGRRKLSVTMTASPKSKGGSAYQIAYRVKGSKTWKYKKTKKRTGTIKKLKKGKKYYVKVRAYKTVNSKKLYGAWSTTRLSSKIK